MDYINKVKVIFTIIFTALAGWLGLLFIPVSLLVLIGIADYWTGLKAAKYRGEAITSGKGARGITKKVCLLLLVAIGAGLDFLVAYTTQAAGIDIPLNFLIGSLVAIWLIANEVISILENMKDIGVDLPPFLMKIAENIKGKTEEKAGN